MSASLVSAVIYAQAADARAVEVVQAVLAQSVQPQAVTVSAMLARTATDLRPFTPRERESTFTAGVRAGQSLACRWVWLLDGRAVPKPTALEALLDASEGATAPPPLLLASKVLDLHGALHPDATPRHEVFEKRYSIDAAARHLVQLRAAAHGSVLIAREAIDRFGLPRSDLPAGLDMHEWTARVLRSWEDIGYLVPASVAVRGVGAPALSWRDWLARVRVLTSTGWRSEEKLWETYLLARDAAAALRGRRKLHGRRGTGAPGLSPSRSPRRIAGIADGANRLIRR